MTKNRVGLLFRADSLDEAMNLNECFIGEMGKHQTFDWHSMVTRSDLPIQEMQPISELSTWGVDIDPDTLQNAENVLKRKRKTYQRNMLPLAEVMKTPEFQRAKEQVIAQFGKPMKDGRVLFPYQIELAAFIVCCKRILNAWEMGLGKTISSIVGIASDPTNKLNLIITMKRNINDWVRELELLGFEDDYVILNSPADIRANRHKRFHLVSYEKWSGDNIYYKKKVHTKCPSCECEIGSIFKRKLQYCKSCRSKAAPITVTEAGKTKDVRWSDGDLPTNCPDCNAVWTKGNLSCGSVYTVRHGGKEEERKCGFTVVERRKPPLSHYFHNGYDATVVDEGHYIKAGDTQRAKSVLRVKTRTRVILTGTPAENEVTDLYWILGWLTGFTSRYEDPVEASSSKPKPFQGFGKVGMDHFRMYYGGGEKRRVLDVDSVQARVGHHEELWKLLDTVMVRKKKSDPDVRDYIKVPIPKHIRYHMELMQAERELYDELVEEFKQWYQSELDKKEAAEMRGDKYRINTILICTWMDKLRKAASCPWSFDGYDAVRGRTTAKLQYLENKIRDYLRRGQKVLLFSGHKETIEQLKLTLDEIIPGRFAEYIHGDVKMEYRWETMKRFQDAHDPLSVLIMSHRTGAESYTLTEAKAVFIVDLDFNGKKLEQCYSRAVRLGQKDVVDVHWLLGVNTIDVNMHGVVLSKIDGVNLAVDRQQIDFAALANEFEGDTKAAASAIDMEEFAKEMLKSGTKRAEVKPATA
jgi:hypothetical protein